VKELVSEPLEIVEPFAVTEPEIPPVTRTDWLAVGVTPSNV